MNRNNIPRRIFFLFLIMIINHGVFGQLVQKDSLLKVLENNSITDSARISTLLKLSSILRLSSYDSASIFEHSALDMSRSTGFYVGEKAALNGLGIVNAMYGYTDSARTYFGLYKELVSNASDTLSTGIVSQNLGNLESQAGKLEEATVHFQYAKYIFQLMGEEERVRRLWVSIGNLYERRNMLDSAEAAYMTGLTAKKKLTNAISHYNLGSVYRKRFEYQKAIEANLKALAYYRENGNVKYVHYCLNKIGTVYKDMEDYDQARKYFREAIDQASEVEDDLSTDPAYNNLGEVFLSLGLTDSAQVALKKSIDLKLSTGRSASLYMPYSALGRAFYDKNMKDSAWIYLDKAMKHAISVASLSGQIGIYQIQSNYYLKEQKYNSSLQSLSKAKQLSVSNGLPLEIIWYELHYKTQKARGRLAEALQSHERLTVLKDSLFNLKKSGAVADILTKYETEKKELENQKLEQNLKQAELETTNQKLQKNNAIILTGLVSLGLAVAIIFSWRERKSRKEIAMLNHELNHRVINNLNAIDSMVQVAASNIPEDGRSVLVDLANRIASITSLHGMLLSQKDISHVDLQVYLSGICNQIGLSFSLPDQRIRLSVNCSGLVPSNISFPLGLIVNEAVTNSYKHAFDERQDGEISLVGKISNGHLDLTITDDGKGFEGPFKSKNGKSFGSKLIKGLTRQLHGTLEIGGSTNGLNLTFKFPLNG